jgi:hypothetical protein
MTACQWCARKFARRSGGSRNASVVRSAGTRSGPRCAGGVTGPIADVAGPAATGSAPSPRRCPSCARGEMATRPRRSPARQPPIAGRPGEGGGGGWEVTGARRYISLRRHAPAGGSCSRTVNAPRGLSPPRRASARLPRRSCRHGLGRFSGSPVSKASREDTSLTAGR